MGATAHTLALCASDARCLVRWQLFAAHFAACAALPANLAGLTSGILWSCDIWSKNSCQVRGLLLLWVALRICSSARRAANGASCRMSMFARRVQLTSAEL